MTKERVYSHSNASVLHYQVMFCERIFRLALIFSMNIRKDASTYHAAQINIPQQLAHKICIVV